MIWLLVFIIITGYLLATHKEIFMYLKLLYEKLKEDLKELWEKINKGRKT